MSTKFVSIGILLVMLVGLVLFPQVSVKAATCDLGTATLTITATSGVKVRALPSTRSRIREKLAVNSVVTLLEYVENKQKVTIGATTSTTWAHVRTQKCTDGYISMATLGGASGSPQPTAVPTQVNAPTQGSNPQGGIPAGGIFASLNVTIFSARRYTGEPLSVPKLIGLNGRAGDFDGGQYPFDDFLYDSPWSQNGYFYDQIILETSGTPAQKNAFVWKQHGREDFLLVWVYRDMNFTDNQSNPCTPGSGNGCGQHHFSWWGAVSKVDWDQATSR